jgi:hypothetical protein
MLHPSSLLYDSSFRCLDEAHELVDLSDTRDVLANSLQGLGRVEFGRKQQVKSVVQSFDYFPGIASPLHARGI